MKKIFILNIVRTNYKMVLIEINENNMCKVVLSESRTYPLAVGRRTKRLIVGHVLPK